MKKRTLTKAEELKLIIIENFIDFYTSDDNEREAIKECAYDYVIEDHCNELEDYVN
jgi:spore maturation protein CgeB